MLAIFFSNRWARTSALIAFLALLTGMFFAVSIPVTKKINELATANSDNVQWTLAQVEVEYFALKTELSLDISGTGLNVAKARNRFDIFYSRISTLRNSQVFAPLREDQEFIIALDCIWGFLQESLPSVDGSDARLAVDRRALLTELVVHRDDVRQLSLRGIKVFAALSDERRDNVSRTLQNTAGIAVALILLLACGLLFVIQLHREGRARGRALKQTTSRLRAIVTTSLAAILVIDKNGRVLDYNGAAEDVFGYTPDEAIGGQMEELIIPDHYRAAHDAGMKRYLATGEKAVIGKGRVVLEAKRKSGEVFPVEFSIATAQSAEGEIFVSFLRDISVRVKTEKDLLEARDKAVAGEKAKADLLAVMSHEMRTPLNGLLGTLDLLGDTVLTPEQERYAQNMLTSGQLLLHHVNDVLDIAKLDSGKVQRNDSEFELTKLITELVDGQSGVAENTENTMTATVLGQGPVNVVGDPMRLRQIILNLLGNAMKFTRNGDIALEVEELPNGLFEFRVTDSGIGISEADLPRVFEDFVTLDASYGRQAGGTGLGLGITKRIVDALGGEIGVESELGEGSMFWVRLPMIRLSVSSPHKQALQAPEPKRADCRALEILLVEDNAINRQVANAMLTKMGHSVVEAYDGDEGVAIATNRAFDLILMDISMPRMDGIQATRLIRKHLGPNDKTPIIALTANALPEDMERFKAAGMNDTIIKPISRSSLAAAIHVPVNKGAEDGETAIVLDPAVLKELAGFLGWPAVLKILSDAKIQAAETLGALHEVQDGQEHGCADQVHKLAGTISLLGGKSFLRALQDTERALRAGEFSSQQATVLSQDWARLLQALEAHTGPNDGQVTAG